MEKKIKRLTAILFIFFMLSGVAGAKEEIRGPYGLKAVIITRNDNTILAWKIPGEAKLLFIGTIYDGQENLTLKYSKRYLGARRISQNTFYIEKGIEKPGILYVFIDPGCSECFKIYNVLKNKDINVRFVPVSIDNKANFKTAATWIKTNQLYNTSNVDLELTSEDLSKLKENNQLYRWLNLDRNNLPTPLIAWTQGRSVETFSGPLDEAKLKDIIRKARLSGGIYATQKI